MLNDHERWLNEIIDARFATYDAGANVPTLDELYVLVGTLKIVGFGRSHERGKARVSKLTRRPGQEEDEYAVADYVLVVPEKPEPRMLSSGAFLRERVIGQGAAITGDRHDHRSY